MTYRNFLDSFLYPFVDGTSDAAIEENLLRKRLCGELQRTFTAPGQPGEMFSGVFAALEARLRQPDGERSPFFAAGQRRILPSFFELLLHLQVRRAGAPCTRTPPLHTPISPNACWKFVLCVSVDVAGGQATELWFSSVARWCAVMCLLCCP